MDDDEQAYLLLLLADSNLPTGSFVASSGLESYITHGFLSPPYTTSLIAFVHDSLHSYAHSALPFVSDAHRIVTRVETDQHDTLTTLTLLDALYESITLNHIARRASTTQGVALLTLYSKAYAPPASTRETHLVATLVDQLKLAIRRGDTPGNLPLCWGVLTGALHLTLDRAQHLALFLHARSLLSAAVRMNTIGPYLAQQMLLRDLRPIIDDLINKCSMLTTAIFSDSSVKLSDMGKLAHQTGPANTWPLGEILGARHDLQHSRLFNS